MSEHDVLALARDQVAHELQLTERWTQLDPHPVQSSLFWHPVRFRSVPAGRRTGKTEIAKRHTVKSLVMDSPYKLRLALAAPTYSRAKEIFFQDVRELIPNFWIKSIKESLNFMEIMTHWGATIRLLGLQRPEVVEGVIWDEIKADEFADCPKRCFEINIRPALATRGRPGRFWALGVPDEVGENQAEHEQLWEKGLKYGRPDGDPDYCSFWWPSSDILTPEEIASLSENMDELTYRQEFGGEFVRSQGKAFPRFQTHLHVDDNLARYEASLPLDHCIDFGSAHSASLICQNYRGTAWVLDEIPMDAGSTEGHSTAFLERASERGFSTHRIGVYGDPAGRTPSSTTGESDYEILKREYRGYNVDWNQLQGAVNIKDTVNAVRARLMNTRREIRLFIHSRCTNLIENLKDAEWPAKNSLREYHFLACLRYYLYTLYGGQSSGVVAVTKASLASDRARFSSRYTP